MAKSFAESGPSSTLASASVARNLERVAWLMDRAVKVPGTKMTVGLDALLGLLPVGGDVLTGFVQAGLVLVALYHYRVPKAVATRMAANVLLDIAVGSIPLLGDLFDLAFKANTRNLKLLEPYRQQQDVPVAIPVKVLDTPLPVGVTTVRTVAPRSGGTPLRLILPIAVVLIAALTLVIIGFVTVVRWLFSGGIS